ncbi:hypothetical protein V8G54_028835, partial [Vigna mungo]
EDKTEQWFKSGQQKPKNFSWEDLATTLPRVFNASCYVSKEFSSFSKSVRAIARRREKGYQMYDGHMGKFTWIIKNLSRWKDLLKKRKVMDTYSRNSSNDWNCFSRMVEDRGKDKKLHTFKEIMKTRKWSHKFCLSVRPPPKPLDLKMQVVASRFPSCDKTISQCHGLKFHCSNLEYKVVLQWCVMIVL